MDLYLIVLLIIYGVGFLTSFFRWFNASILQDNKFLYRVGDSFKLALFWPIGILAYLLSKGMKDGDKY